jgi:serine/threonine-protein kinase
VRSDGSGQPQQVYELKNGSAVPWSFTPDGKRLAFHQNGDRTLRDIWILPLDLTDSDHPKAGKPELFLATPSIDVEPVFSPDGRWLAYTSSEAGTANVYVRPFPPSAVGGKWQVSASAARFPVWSRTAKELFYISNNRIMVVSYTISGDTFSPGPPRQWSEVLLASTANAAPYDIAPDGKRFLILSSADNSSGSEKANVHVTFLLNFFDELKRRMP